MGWRATTAGGDGREVTSGRVTGPAGPGAGRSGQVRSPGRRLALPAPSWNVRRQTGGRGRVHRVRRKTKIMLKPPPGDHCGPKVARAAVRAARRPAQY